MAISLVVFMYALWSSVFAFGKMTLQYCPPLFLTGVRMSFAGLLLLGGLALFRRKAFKINRSQLLSLLLLAFFSIYATNVLEFWGQQYLSSAKTCFIYSLSPLFTALLSYLHFNERMNGQKWMGLGISALGFIPVLSMQTGSEDLFHAFGFFSWPSLAIVGAALCSVYGWILLRLVVKDQEISPLMANGSSMLIGGLFALIHSWFAEGWFPIPVKEHHLAPFLQGSLIIVLISNLICYNLYGMLLKRFTATFLSFMGLLSPIFASLHGSLFLGEPFSWMIILSTGFVSLGLWFVYRAELRQGYILKGSAPS